MLSLIPTPIGNLDDITIRAVQLLKDVDYILVEDSRKSGRLLNHLGIEKKMVPFHSHNEHQKLTSIIDDLKAGKHVGMITDAGTPGISDPGFLLVRECVIQDIQLECLPGATAFVPALVNSGLPTDEFLFIGFLPKKKGRKTKLEELATLSYTIIIYESPYRVIKTVGDILNYFGDRPISVSREISKKFEETIRGMASQVLEQLKQKEPKGEFVICIGGLKD